jgi:hypothetical protein
MAGTLYILSIYQHLQLTEYHILDISPFLLSLDLIMPSYLITGATRGLGVSDYLIYSL